MSCQDEHRATLYASEKLCKVAGDASMLQSSATDIAGERIETRAYVCQPTPVVTK